MRDNTSSSTMTTDNLDLSGFEELTIDFSYYPRSMESGEDFWLQVSTNGGSSYTTVATWAQGTDFSNNSRFNESVTLTSGFAASNARLRFRCDASSNSDYVYIDDVVISGCSNGTSSVIVSNRGVQTELMEAFDFSDLTVYPNPVRNLLNIQNLPADARVRLVSLTGQVLGDFVGRSQFDVSGMVPGLYLLQVTVDEETRVFKISKK